MRTYSDRLRVDEYHSAAQDGGIAFRAGHPIGTNPHQPGCRERYGWQEGWYAAYRIWDGNMRMAIEANAAFDKPRDPVYSCPRDDWAPRMVPIGWAGDVEEAETIMADYFKATRETRPVGVSYQDVPVGPVAVRSMGWWPRYG